MLIIVAPCLPLNLLHTTRVGWSIMLLSPPPELRLFENCEDRILETGAGPFIRTPGLKVLLKQDQQAPEQAFQIQVTPDRVKPAIQSWSISAVVDSGLVEICKAVDACQK